MTLLAISFRSDSMIIATAHQTAVEHDTSPVDVLPEYFWLGGELGAPLRSMGKSMVDKLNYNALIGYRLSELLLCCYTMVPVIPPATDSLMI